MSKNEAVQITKIAAAQRLLDAAIRIFFQKEDELAVHAIAAQPFRVLRDIIKKRGGHFTAEAFRSGLFSAAQQYLAGTLSSDLIGSRLMPQIEKVAEQIQLHGSNFRQEHIRVVDLTEQQEGKLWLSRITNFLKHAENDPDGFLFSEELDIERLLMGGCSAYVTLMKHPTAEIAAYFVFWAAKNSSVNDLAPEVQQFARQVEAAEENRRYEMCSEFIRDHKLNGVSKTQETFALQT